MRVHLDGDLKAEEFSTLVLRVGDGKLLEDNEGKCAIPQNLCHTVSDMRLRD